MHHNKFSLRVVGGDERENGYVFLPHGKEYRLSLRNDRELPCDAEVAVDGKHSGTFRIQAHSNILLERPADDHGKFTFLEIDTPEASAAGLVKGDSSLGLVSVRFRPGYVRPVVSCRPLRVVPYRSPWYDPYYPYWPCYPWSSGSFTISSGANTTITTANVANVSYTCAAENVASRAAACTLQETKAGGTGLSGHSSQEFHTVADLDYLANEEVTINLRLVSSGKIAAIRPLQPSATPVPPPVS